MRSIIFTVLVFSLAVEAKTQKQASHMLMNCEISNCHRKHQKTIVVCDSISGLTIKTVLITSGSSYDMNGFAPLRKKSIQYVYDANKNILVKGISKSKHRGDATLTIKSNYISFDQSQPGFKIFHQPFLSGNGYWLKYDVYGNRISKTRF